jgi:hypothetical protein
MKKITIYLVFTLFLSSCSSSNFQTLTTSSNNSSIVISSNAPSSEAVDNSTSVIPVKVIKVTNSVIPNFTVDFGSKVVMPKYVKVSYEDGSEGREEVDWEKINIKYQNLSKVVVKGKIINGNIEVTSNIEFKDILIEKSIKDEMYISNDLLGLYYTVNDEHYVEEILEYLTVEYSRLLDFFGYKQIPRINGYIFPNDKEHRRILQRDFRIGMPSVSYGAGISSSEYSMISHINPPGFTGKADLYQITLHELLHSIHFYQIEMSPFVNDMNDTPVWLREGLATYLTQNMRITKSQKEVIDRDDFTLSVLNSREARLDDIAYGAGGLLIKHLLELYGLEKFRVYMNTLDFLEAFGVSEATIAASFRKYFNQELVGENASFYYRDDYPFPQGLDINKIPKGTMLPTGRNIMFSSLLDRGVRGEAATKFSNIYSLQADNSSGSRAIDVLYDIIIVLFNPDRIRIDFEMLGLDEGKIKPGMYKSFINQHKQRVVFIYPKTQEDLSAMIDRLPLTLIEKDFEVYE